MMEVCYPYWAAVPMTLLLGLVLLGLLAAIFIQARTINQLRGKIKEHEDAINRRRAVWRKPP